MDCHSLGECTDGHGLYQGITARCGQRVQAGRIGAKHRFAARTGRAASAGADQRGKDRVADIQAGDAVAEGGDMTGCLVAEHGRQIAAPDALGKGDVGMANCTGGEVNLNFAGSRRGKLDVFDLQGLTELVADGGFDGAQRGPRFARDDFPGDCGDGRGGLQAQKSAALRAVGVGDIGAERALVDAARKPGEYLSVARRSDDRLGKFIVQSYL